MAEAPAQDVGQTEHEHEQESIRSNDGKEEAAASSTESKLTEVFQMTEEPTEKKERLEQFREIVKSNRLDFLDNLVAIDFSNLPLSRSDIAIVGIIANMAVNLESLDLRGCQLQKGFLVILKSQLKSVSTKIGKLSVTKNPNLGLDDLKAGMDISLKSGGIFIYDNKYLSEEDAHRLKLNKRRLQASTPKSSERFSKRRHITKEEKFQKLYKGRLSESGLARLKVCILDLSKNLPSNVEEREKSATEKGPISSSNEMHVGKAEKDPKYQVENVNEKKNALRRKMKMYLARTVKAQVLKRFEVEKSELPKLTRKFENDLKKLAKFSDWKEFRSLAMSRLASSRVRRNVEITQLKALEQKFNERYSKKELTAREEKGYFPSTIFGKGDGEYKSRTSATTDKGSVLQIPTSDRHRASRHLPGEDNEKISGFVENQGSYGSTESPPPEDTISNFVENQGSYGSTESPPPREMANSGWDPLRIQQQSFEMTCRGLGMLVDSQERVQKWLQTEDFQQVPDDDQKDQDVVASQMSNLAITDTGSSNTVGKNCRAHDDDEIRQPMRKFSEQESLKCGFQTVSHDELKEMNVVASQMFNIAITDKSFSSTCGKDCRLCVHDDDDEIRPSMRKSTEQESLKCGFQTVPDDKLKEIDFVASQMTNVAITDKSSSSTVGEECSARDDDKIRQPMHIFDKQKSLKCGFQRDQWRLQNQARSPSPNALEKLDITKCVNESLAFATEQVDKSIAKIDESLNILKETTVTSDVRIKLLSRICEAYLFAGQFKKVAESVTSEELPPSEIIPADGQTRIEYLRLLCCAAEANARLYNRERVEVYCLTGEKLIRDFPQELDEVVLKEYDEVRHRLVEIEKLVSKFRYDHHNRIMQNDEPEEEDLIANQLSNIAITDTSSSSTSSGSSSTNMEDSADEKVTQSITEIAEPENFEYGFTKLRKKTTILTSGGRISIDECYIDFPQNCFDTDTEVTLSLDMDYRSVEIPDNSTPITPIVGVEHKGELNLEAAINMPSWYKPVSVFEHVKIFKSVKNRHDSKSEFLFERNATLSNGYITFSSKHFCRRFCTAAISSIQSGSIKLAHALLQNDHNFRVVVSFLNPSKLLKQKIKHCIKQGYKEIHLGHFKLSEDRTEIALKSQQPDLYKFLPVMRVISKSDFHKTKSAKHFLQNTIEKNFNVIPTPNVYYFCLEYTVNGREPEPYTVRVTPAQSVVKGDSGVENRGANIHNQFINPKIEAHNGAYIGEMGGKHDNRHMTSQEKEDSQAKAHENATTSASQSEALTEQQMMHEGRSDLDERDSRT